MSVTKEDLLKLANDLIGAGTEVEWRAAVSRAYYAAYHGCLAWHAGMPLPGSLGNARGGVHDQFLNQLRNGAPEWSESQRKMGRLLSAQLGALKDRRKAADYVLDEPFDNVQATVACASAVNLVEKL